MKMASIILNTKTHEKEKNPRVSCGALGKQTRERNRLIN